MNFMLNTTVTHFNTLPLYSLRTSIDSIKKILKITTIFLSYSINLDFLIFSITEVFMTFNIYAV